MSYPQPDSDEAVLNGLQFFRLKTTLTSAGDIYESAQGANAFMLGPDSDVAKVSMAYFDIQATPTYVQKVAISPDRGFAGFVPAPNNTAQYAPANRPAKILMWNDAIYNADYLPVGFNPNQDEINTIKPVLDVMQYFVPLASLQSSRADKEYLFQHLPFPIRTYYLLIPYYGRRYAMVNIFNKTSPPVDLTCVISGINFAIAENNVDNENMVHTLSTTTVVAGTETVIAPITASQDGMFDYLQIAITGDSGLAGPVPLKIVVSDHAE